MRTIFIYIVFSSILFFSCETKETDIEIPPNVLSEDKLVKVLTDCYLGEGASGINVKNVTGEKFYRNGILKQEKIYFYDVKNEFPQAVLTKYPDRKTIDLQNILIEFF